MNSNRQVPAQPHFAICLDSMSKLTPANDKYQVILIDECEQVLRHLVGATVRPVRRAVFKRLEHYLRQAEQVVLLDADLGMITLTLLDNMKWKPDTRIRFVINTVQP